MSQQTQTCERYLTQKELVGALESEFGLSLSVRYIYAIKAATDHTPQPLFIVGKARASEVFAWIKANPQFRRSSPGIA